MDDRPAPEPTPRELEVLRLICEGHSTKQVAGLLGISVKTAACHRMRLMEKANVHDPINLLRWAIQRGYVTIEKGPASASKLESECTADGWGLDAPEGAVFGSLAMALDGARNRFLAPSREFIAAPAEVATGLTDPEGILLLEIRANHGRAGFEEYRPTRESVADGLLEDDEEIEATDET